jgi:RHS repeat-associated protein
VYDFLLRQQSAAQGRWLAPDPAGLAAVDIANPQTWNRYAYVANNPLGNVDPLGLAIDNPGYRYDLVWRAWGFREPIAGLFRWMILVEPRDPASSNHGKETNSPPSDSNDSVDCSNPPLVNVGQPPDKGDVIANMTTAAGRSLPQFWADSWKGGMWDFNAVYKDGRYDQFGNFNFGAVCNAKGYLLYQCQNGAGLAQVATDVIHGFKYNVWQRSGHGLPYSTSPYGDRGKDSALIAQGYAFANWVRTCKGWKQAGSVLSSGGN